MNVPSTRTSTALLALLAQTITPTPKQPLSILIAPNYSTRSNGTAGRRATRTSRSADPTNRKTEILQRENSL